MPGRASDPIVIPESLWQRPQVIQALQDRDIRSVFLLLRQYAGASQTQIAIACGMTQGKVSETMKQGGRQVSTLEVFERIADGLQMPDPARMTLGLAPKNFTSTEPPASARAVITSRDEPAGLAPAPSPSSLDTDLELSGEGDAVRRRTLGKLAGASVFSAILADLPTSGAPLQGVEAFAAALADYPGTGANPSPTDLSLPRLSKAVATAKRNYQDCRYSTVIDALPALLGDLRAASGTHKGDDRLRAEALSAEAHHVAASILLKLDHEGLAWIAADRSMQAAHNSQDLTIIGSSARIITHALMNDGHCAAANTASSYAQRIDHEVDERTPDFLSVYGALLLRGAVAAGQRSDRHTAATLLDEAQAAGQQLGGDYNLRWTAFGPTNVQLHRVNIALQLGDAGAAIQQARTIDLDRVPLTERKATLLMDTSRALAQWGKHDKAYEVLRVAHQLAPEEVASRPSAHRMLANLMTTAPPSVQRQVREFSTDIGVTW
ncbi:helix-turn-helix domain-containing protein [Actinomadura hibisca]|uniref:helix-turn-helix domain-containing protein n=1 Tax=Actinomadura hibisca TaxID=68565 RepID=UPI00082E50B1|nr:helix-turn-helix domain-containing protein [Actinomadura hibisca]